MATIRKVAACFAPVLAAAIVAAVSFCTQARAQDYPVKPVTLIVPFPAGGSTDITMRAIAEVAGKHLGQPVLIDNKAGIIIDAVGTRANRAVEIAVTQTMVDRVERRFDLRPRRLAGDTAYGAVRLLKWLVDRNITPHVPVWDKSARPDGTFSRADFVFDQERNIYVCPGGSELTSTGNIDQGHIVYYRASKSDCSRCSLKPKCTTAIVRKLTRDLNEDVRDRVRALANTEAFQQSRRERKKVEMRFAHMKRILRLDRLRLRGLRGVRDEVLLTATAQNLRRLAKLLYRAPPPLAATCPA